MGCITCITWVLTTFGSTRGPCGAAHKWASYGTHMGPIYGQPMWAPSGARGQMLLGPTWAAYMGPAWVPIWVPFGCVGWDVIGVFLGPCPSPQRKRYLDRFRSFYRAHWAKDRLSQTDRQTTSLGHSQ